jgi:hypothetical protein
VTSTAQGAAQAAPTGYVNMWTEAAELAARGAVWLDVREPDWFNRVDPDRLVMIDPDWCVAGQVFGGSRGFDLVTDELLAAGLDYIDYGFGAWPLLVEPWRREVLSRRDKVKESA